MLGATTVKRIWKAFLISVVLSAGLAVVAWGLGQAGLSAVARLLVWPAVVLQSLVSAPNIGTESQPLYEGTQLHLVAFSAGLAAQVPIYWVAIYAVLRAKHDRST